MRISMPGLYTEYDGTASRQFMLATALKTASLALSESRQNLATRTSKAVSLMFA